MHYVRDQITTQRKGRSSLYQNIFKIIQEKARQYCQNQKEALCGYQKVPRRALDLHSKNEFKILNTVGHKDRDSGQRKHDRRQQDHITNNHSPQRADHRKSSIETFIMIDHIHPIDPESPPINPHGGHRQRPYHYIDRRDHTFRTLVLVFLIAKGPRQQRIYFEQ